MKATPGTAHHCAKCCRHYGGTGPCTTPSYAHSIWELVHHIAVWENVGRRRLTGDRAAIDISSPEDWPPADDTDDAAWEQAKAALDRGHQALVEAITKVTESRLDAPVFEGMSTVYVTLHGVIQHDLYHAGQIAMLKKAL